MISLWWPRSRKASKYLPRLPHHALPWYGNNGWGQTKPVNEAQSFNTFCRKKQFHQSYTTFHHPNQWWCYYLKPREKLPITIHQVFRPSILSIPGLRLFDDSWPLQPTSSQAITCIVTQKKSKIQHQNEINRTWPSLLPLVCKKPYHTVVKESSNYADTKMNDKTIRAGAKTPNTEDNNHLIRPK